MLTNVLTVVLECSVQYVSWLLVHWNRNVFVLMKFSSLTTTTSNVASDDIFVKMTLLFQYSITVFHIFHTDDYLSQSLLHKMTMEIMRCIGVTKRVVCHWLTLAVPLNLFGQIWSIKLYAKVLTIRGTGWEYVLVRTLYYAYLWPITIRTSTGTGIMTKSVAHRCTVNMHILFPTKFKVGKVSWPQHYRLSYVYLSLWCLT